MQAQSGLKHFPAFFLIKWVFSLESFAYHFGSFRVKLELSGEQCPSPGVTERSQASPSAASIRSQASPAHAAPVTRARRACHRRTPAPVTRARPCPTPALVSAHQRPCTSTLAPEYPFKGSTESPDSQTLPRLFPRIPRLGKTLLT
ncbi:hypothetical protein CDL15_Pgr026341 [Punica granatum]|uniref:Uncharacterized protein n=1 Tax=Punica granatum TaxID=22663 RepID=A0A218WPE3_PUNGR|nr:hypothetical protein CDL15_Pgr026341 [Punica granatum]